MRDTSLLVFLFSVYFFVFCSQIVEGSNFDGYYSQGKGKTEVNNYDSFLRSVCEPTAVPFNDLISFGTPKAVLYECPNGHEISGIEYTTDSLRLYITGIRFICSDNESFILLGSEKFVSDRVSGKYHKGGINEVAFGYDPEKPIIKLLQIVKEASLPKGSELLLSFIPSGDQLLRSRTFLGEKPTKLCAVIIQNSEFVAPVIGNLILQFSMERPLARVQYGGFVYTGVPNVNLGIPDNSECSSVSGVGTSSSKDVNFRISCPEGRRIIGINMNLGDRINSYTLKNISDEILKSSGILFEKENWDNNGFYSLIDNLGHKSEFYTSEYKTVNNFEILMLKFLCSDYITSFSIGQPLSNSTSWNILDKIPRVEKWVSSPELIGSEVLDLVKKTAEKSLILGTADVMLGNINSVLLGYSTGKLKIKAILEGKNGDNLGPTVSDYVERYTFGPIFIDVGEYTNFDFQTRNILKLLPEVYPSSAIDARKGYSGDIFRGICGRVMYGSFLLASFGFETSKIVKPFYRQIFMTPGIKVEKNSKNGTFNCNMLFSGLVSKYSSNSYLNEDTEIVRDNLRSSLRSFQGSLKCPPGTSIESIQLLESIEFGRIDSMRFNCGEGFETYFVLGTESGIKLLSGTFFLKNKIKNYNILTSQISQIEPKSGEILYDLISSISISRSKHFVSNSVRIPEFNLPISAFSLAQKNKNETISYISKKYPPDSGSKKTWENGVLTQVCIDIKTDGVIGNIGFNFEYPFNPTTKTSISESHGFSTEGNGIVDADTKGFECDGMLHSSRSQLLFNKHVNDIILSGKLKSKSKKTLIRAINFKCPGSSIINRVEASWSVSRGSSYVYNSRSGEKRGISGSIVALKFFCSDGRSTLKVGADSRTTHSQKNMLANEIFMGYRALTNDEILKVKKNLLQDNTINVTEELLKSLPGDPVSFKIVHESFPVSTLQFDVSGSKQYKSAEEALDSINLKDKQALKSKIWKGGNWKGVCVGLLNLSGGLIVKNEFSITSFGAYFEKPSPLVKMPYRGYIQTGIPQIHRNKVISTCDMTTPPKYGYEYPGFSATFMCPNGTHIERIGYSTVENGDNGQYEILKNGTLNMPPPFKEQKHLGPLGQIRSLTLICSDGITTITIGEPSRPVAYSAPGEIGTIKIGYIKNNSELVSRSTKHYDFLVPASIEILAKDSKERLLKFSNPNYPEYAREVSSWSGENLRAVCVDFAILEDVRNDGKNKPRSYLSWAGSAVRIPEKHHIMSIGFAFQRRTVVRRQNVKQEATRTVKAAKRVQKIKIQKRTNH
ncbi:hypothetical protein FG386_002094 [Cryptosporidium ryanae]|uniref:uncharacterized protein n=1 Tax=Cryptosporidium ryanae TaxID=515981 RepID=UPI00351AAE07|nr:hypothetical protein FG386_002094 [Cryptosporidium ryanae]